MVVNNSKIDKHLKEVVFGWPKTAQLDLTNRCNLSCSFCYADANRSNISDLSFDKIIEVLQTLHANNIKDIIFTGGEPFLREDFFQILEYASKKDFKIKINTNGTLLNKKSVEYLSNINFQAIEININGPPEIHDNIVGVQGSFFRSLNALELLKDNGLEKSISLGSIVMQQNLRYLSKTYKSSSKKFPKAKDYRILFPIPAGRGLHYKTLFGTINENFWFKVFNELKRIKHNEKIPLIIEHGLSMIIWKLDKKFELPDRNYLPFCNAGKRRLIIISNGDVVPCNFLRNKQFVAGNIFSTPISELWNNIAIKQFRELLSHKTEFCKNCRVWNACRGGCKAWSFTINNSIFTNDPRCEWLSNQVINKK